MSQERPVRSPVSRIEIHLQIGESLMAASDDPLFLGLAGPCGREFRLELARGRSLRRGAQDHYVLGSSRDAPPGNDVGIRGIGAERIKPPEFEFAQHRPALVAQPQGSIDSHPLKTNVNAKTPNTRPVM